MCVVVLCVLMHKAHGDGDCCEAMHAFVGVCVSACTRRMLTVIAARRCMRVLVCVFSNVLAFSMALPVLSVLKHGCFNALP